MKRVSCQLSEEVAKRVREKARESQQSVSSYLRSLIEKDIPDQWPEGYFEVFGKGKGHLNAPIRESSRLAKVLIEGVRELHDDVSPRYGPHQSHTT